MTREDARRFAEALDKEAAVIWSGYDNSTAPQESFRHRVETLHYALRIFESLVGVTPARFMEFERANEGNTLRFNVR